MLENHVLFPAPESNGLMKNKQSCSVQGLALQGMFWYELSALHFCVLAALSSGHFSSEALPAFCRKCLVHGQDVRVLTRCALVCL